MNQRLGPGDVQRQVMIQARYGSAESTWYRKSYGYRVMFRIRVRACIRIQCCEITGDLNLDITLAHISSGAFYYKTLTLTLTVHHKTKTKTSQREREREREREQRLRPVSVRSELESGKKFQLRLRLWLWLGCTRCSHCTSRVSVGKLVERCAYKSIDSVDIQGYLGLRNGKNRITSTVKGKAKVSSQIRVKISVRVRLRV